MCLSSIRSRVQISRLQHNFLCSVCNLGLIWIPLFAFHIESRATAAIFLVPVKWCDCRRYFVRHTAQLKMLHRDLLVLRFLCFCVCFAPVCSIKMSTQRFVAKNKHWVKWHNQHLWINMTDFNNDQEWKRKKNSAEYYWWRKLEKCNISSLRFRF